MNIQPKSTRYRIIINWIGTLTTICVLLYLLSQQGWREISEVLKSIPFWRLSMALGLTFISRLAVVGRWHVLLKSVGLQVHVKDSLQLTFAGLFASQFLPTTVGGDLVRLAGGIRVGIDRYICFSSLVVDRVVGMIGMGIAALGMLLNIPDVSFHYSNIFIREISLRTAHSLFVFSGGRKFFLKVWDKATRIVEEVINATKIWFLHPHGLILSLLFTWVHMICVFGSIYLIIPALGENMPFWKIGGLWSLTYFVTLLPISVNGLGLQELSIAYFYSQFGGLRLSSGLTIALLHRLFMLIASLPGAFTISGSLIGQTSSTNNDIDPEQNRL